MVRTAPRYLEAQALEAGHSLQFEDFWSDAYKLDVKRAIKACGELYKLAG